MAFELTRHPHQLALIAGSAVLPNTPVRLAGTQSAYVLPVASSNQRPFGWVKATAGASGLDSGETVTIFEDTNIVKAVAAASVGAGVEVMVGSNNGALYDGAASLFAASGHWAVGLSLTAANAGEVFALEVKVRKA